MPSPIAHVAAGYGLYRLYAEKIPDTSQRVLGVPVPLLILAGVSILPDLDAVPGVLFGNFGRFHNQASHSLAAGMIAALGIASLVSWKRKEPWMPWFGAVLLAYEAHLFLDLFSGERGLMLLWPLTEARYVSPVRLFYGVQWGLGWISLWHVWTLLTEILFVVLIFMLGKLVVFAKRSLFH